MEKNEYILLNFWKFEIKNVLPNYMKFDRISHMILTYSIALSESILSFGINFHYSKERNGQLSTSIKYNITKHIHLSIMRKKRWASLKHQLNV